MISEKSSSELIQELNLIDESESVEAKEISGNEVGKSFYETVCAFSNEPKLGGGTIILGVKKENLLFSIYETIGIKNIDKILNDIASACQTKFNIPIRPRIRTEIVDGLSVIRVDVSELSSVQKPLYIQSSGLPKGAYRRIGSSDVRCTQEDLIIFYQDRQANTFDVHVAPGSSINDIDPIAIGNYRKALEQNNPSSDILNWTDVDILIALSAIREVDQKLRATANGILTLGKGTSIRRNFPMARVDYIRVPGKHWIENPDTRFDSTDMRGPIITLINRVIAAISDDLPRAFRLDENKSAQRIDMPIIPYRVIREAIVNSLMHRNYNISRPIQIIRYSNRLTIENPGYSLKSTEKFSDPGSLSRNPHIAAILHETGYAETKGSGLRVMKQLLIENGLSVPTFESNRQEDTFKVTFLFHHLLSKENWSWLSLFKDLKLTDDQMRALVYVREAGQIDNATFRELTGLDILDASSNLRRLKSLELFDTEGSGSRTYYIPGQKFLSLTSDTLDIIGASSNDMPYRSNDNHVESDSESQQGVRRDQLPGRLKEIVTQISLGRRIAPEKMKEIILALCRIHPLSSEEIATLLSKKQTYILQNFLTPMQKEGILEHTIPEKPNHPDQKYRAK